MSDEALVTSRIEGEILDRDSLQSSCQRHFGIKEDQRKIRPAERGISELVVDGQLGALRRIGELKHAKYHLHLDS